MGEETATDGGERGGDESALEGDEGATIEAETFEEPIAEDIDAADVDRSGPPRVVGVLLAAGSGTRFEDDDLGPQGPRTKLVATLQGEPIVRHAGRALAESDVDVAVAVVGDAAELVTEALEGFGMSAVRNPDYHRGKSTSLVRGVRAAVSFEADAAVFALGDMPLVDPATIDTLLEVHAEEGAGIVVPTHDGRRGNPVLFDRMHFENLAHVTGDEGGRRLFRDESVRTVEVPDPGIHEDIDTVDDLFDIREELSSLSDRL